MSRGSSVARARDTTEVLSGLRVLAIEQVFAAPYATQILADFGADVVVVEPADRVNENDVWRMRTGRRKQRILVNLADGRGQRVVRALARRADVLVENYRPGHLARFGLGYEQLARVARSLVYVSISGFGQRDVLPSPYSERAAYGTTAEALSGITATLLERGREGSTGLALDVVTALFAACGMLIALEERRRTGRGTHVDIALTDCHLALAELALVRGLGKRSSGADRLGSHDTVLDGVFDARDGRFCVTVVSDSQWKALARVIDRSDERVARQVRGGAITGSTEAARRDLQRWAQQRRRRDVVARLTKAGLAAAPVLTSREIVADPHFRARQMIVQVGSAKGTLSVPWDPIKLSRPRSSPHLARRAPRRLHIAVPGENTREILKRWLAMSAQDVNALLSGNVIRDDDGPTTAVELSASSVRLPADRAGRIARPRRG